MASSHLGRCRTVSGIAVLARLMVIYSTYWFVSAQVSSHFSGRNSPRPAGSEVLERDTRLNIPLANAYREYLNTTIGASGPFYADPTRTTDLVET